MTDLDLSASDRKGPRAPWGDLWNGGLDQAGRIIAEQFAAHAGPLTGTGPDEMLDRRTLRV